MPTVTDIPQEECALFDEKPTLIKFGEAMGASRFVRMTAIYLLRETLEAAPREAHEDICLAFAEKGGKRSHQPTGLNEFPSVTSKPWDGRRIRAGDS